MKLLAYLLITIGLIAGALASATAYLVRIDDASSQEQLVEAGLVLKSPAGIYDPTPTANDEAGAELAERVKSLHGRLDELKRQAQAIPNLTPELDIDLPEPPAVEGTTPAEALVRATEARAPIGRAGDPLTAELIELLRENGVEHVRVKSFSLLRWPHAWLFGVGVVLLLLGAGIVKSQRRATAKLSPQGEKVERAGAHAAIANISEAVQSLDRDLPGMASDRDRLHAIIERLGAVQRDYVPAFAADRPSLVARCGLGGFAEIMDSFAGMERQINRAWSAAADGELEESVTYLRAALESVPVVREKLPEG